MPLFTTSQTFTAVDRSDGNTTYQDGCVGGRYKCVTAFYFQKGTINNQANGIVMTLNIQGNVITDVTSYGPSQQPENFMDDFSINEKIRMPGSTLNTGEYTITSLTQSSMTISGPALTTEAPNSYIWVSTKLTGLDYYYNLLNNSASPSFISLVDPNTQQKYIVSGIDASNVSTPVSFTIGTPTLSWVTDTLTGLTSQASIIGGGITADYRQQFIITHYYFITPLATAPLLQTFMAAKRAQANPTPPANYPLTYFYQINAYYVSGTPAIIATLQSQAPNGVGAWIDNNNSNTVPEFYTSAISYIDDDTGLPLTGLDFGKRNLVTMTITSQSGLFTADYINNFILSHVYIPQILSDYQGTKTTLRQNFMHDRAIQTVGASAINGEFYGTAYQVFCGVTVTYVNANTCNVTFLVNYASEIQDFFLSKAAGNRTYVLLCEVE